MAADALEEEGDVSAPVVGGVHVGHGAADEEEVLGLEVRAEVAGVDRASHDASEDRWDVGPLGGDVGPAWPAGAEEREAERGVGLGGLRRLPLVPLSISPPGPVVSVGTGPRSMRHG